MKFISQSEYESRMKHIQAVNASKERARKLKEEENKYKSKWKLPPTSKLMAVYLFIILNVILVYAMVAMWYFRDLTYLGVLITDVASQVLTYKIYCKKSTTENSAGGIVYETTMKQLEMRDDIPVG